jgi:methionyl-tRNA synthetase
MSSDIEVTDGYYCDRCKGFVAPTMVVFVHPHRGKMTAYGCSKCGGMVYIKKKH